MKGIDAEIARLRVGLEVSNHALVVKQEAIARQADQIAWYQRRETELQTIITAIEIMVNEGKSNRNRRGTFEDILAIIEKERRDRFAKTYRALGTTAPMQPVDLDPSPSVVTGHRPMVAA